MTPKERHELYLLMNALREDCITDAQFKQLDDLIADNPEVCRLYVDYTKMWADLQKFQTSANPTMDPEQLLSRPSSGIDGYNAQLWQALADEEKMAPGIKVAKEPVKPELIQKVIRQREPRQINKFSIVSGILSTAAILMLVLFAKFGHQKQYNYEVATLIDQINAEWGHTDTNMQQGVRFITSNHDLYLKKGIVEFLFDNGTRITVEGPAEFQVLSGDTVNLGYGRLYAVVTKEGYGFQVCTDGSKIIDLGTEFGVEKDLYGKVELHVMKGKTCLISGSGNQQIDMDVLQNSAVQLNTETGQVHRIGCNKDLFVRGINSALHLIWRGETADVHIPNHSFESPSVGFGKSMFGLDNWSVNGRAGVSSNGSVGSRINQVSSDGSQIVLIGIDGGLINLPNRDGDQIAWMNTDVDTSLTQFLPDTFAKGLSYELTVGLARAAWNPPDDVDQLQMQFCYEDAAGHVKVLAARTVTASELNWSDGHELIEFTLSLNKVQAAEKWVGQPIGIRLISTYEGVATESGDWVIDNLSLKVKE